MSFNSLSEMINNHAFKSKRTLEPTLNSREAHTSKNKKSTPLDN